MDRRNQRELPSCCIKPEDLDQLLALRDEINNQRTVSKTRPTTAATPQEAISTSSQNRSIQSPLLVRDRAQPLQVGQDYNPASTGQPTLKHPSTLPGSVRPVSVDPHRPVDRTPETYTPLTQEEILARHQQRMNKRKGQVPQTTPASTRPVQSLGIQLQPKDTGRYQNTRPTEDQTTTNRR